MRIDRELFRTGVPLIDQQHEAYLELVERVFQLCAKADVDLAQLTAEVNQTLVYAVEHFDTEEELMRSVRYPLLNQHVAKHNLFRAQADLFAAEIKGPVVVEDFTPRLAKWLVDWFVLQVQTDDRLLAVFLKKQKPDRPAGKDLP